MSKKRTYEGIEVRHERSCASRQGARCNCAPSYRAYVYSPLDERKLRKSFRSLAERGRGDRRRSSPFARER